MTYLRLAWENLEDTFSRKELVDCKYIFLKKNGKRHNKETYKKANNKQVFLYLNAVNV